MTPLEKRRLLHELGQRAVDYYMDTGLCVFCGADDVEGIPHDSGDVPCHVGRAAGVQVTPERAAEKKRQRGIVDEFMRRDHFLQDHLK
jgi:hypothetical protein